MPFPYFSPALGIWDISLVSLNSRCTEFLRWYSGMTWFLFALMRMRIIQLPFSSHEYLLWFGAHESPSRLPPYFTAVVWIPAHTMPFENEWTQRSLRNGDFCVPQIFLGQIHSLWKWFFSLFYTAFTLMSCLWFLMTRSLLGRLGEFLSSISWEEGSSRCICVLMHMRVCKYMCMCMYARVSVFVCTCEQVFVDVHCTVAGLYCTFQIWWH